MQPIQHKEYGSYGEITSDPPNIPDTASGVRGFWNVMLPNQPLSFTVSPFMIPNGGLM